MWRRFARLSEKASDAQFAEDGGATVPVVWTASGEE
jgi:hypothetical protein